MQEVVMQAPDKKQWRKAWNKAEVKELLLLAKSFRTQGAIDDRAAWMAAEENYRSETSPYFRRENLGG